MKKRRNNGGFVSLGLHILGFSLCSIPPFVCTLSYFPLWKSTGFGTCIAGGSALLLVMCFFPILKFFNSAIKNYGSYFLWGVCFVLFFALSRIAEQMIVISLIGFIGNVLGSLCFAIADRRRDG